MSSDGVVWVYEGDAALNQHGETGIEELGGEVATLRETVRQLAESIDALTDALERAVKVAVATGGRNYGGTRG